MRWLAGWDFPTRAVPTLPMWLGQLLFAIICTIGFILSRIVMDVFAPTAGAFALAYPAVLIAALFGRWQAGIGTIVLTVGYVWRYLLPVYSGFWMRHPSDEARVATNAVSLIIIVLLAEIFRRAVAEAAAERERRIEERELLLREIDHRVKNNFASVSGLIQLQRQRATDPVVADELGTALSRIESFATAHQFLYRDGTDVDAVEMQPYLVQLCAALSQALLRSDRVRLSCDVQPITMPRDRAVSIGLIVNELVTNAAKHAFPDDREGRITVSLARTQGGMDLVVEDDGRGLPETTRDGSLGRRLIASFVRQAAGELATTSGPSGTCCRVTLS